MPSTVRDIMTTDLVMCPSSATIADAARLMRDRSIGDVLVTSGEELRGILTDRDIVVRCLAEGATPDMAIEGACSGDITTITPEISVEAAAKLMRDRALRRLPVVEDGRPVGIVSLGDLAVEDDRRSALGTISAAPPNN